MKKILFTATLLTFSFQTNLHAFSEAPKIDPKRGLFKAIKEDNFEMVKYWLSLKPDLNPEEEKNNAALKSAVIHNNIPILELLINYYAQEYNLHPFEEKAFKQKVILDPQEQFELNIKLIEALKKEGNEKEIRELVEQGADVNAIETHISLIRFLEWFPPNYALSVLEYAYCARNVKNYELLLELGADPYKKNNRRGEGIYNAFEIANRGMRVEGGRGIKAIVNILKKYKTRRLLTKAYNIVQKSKTKEVLRQIKNWPDVLSDIVCEY